MYVAGSDPAGSNPALGSRDEPAGAPIGSDVGAVSLDCNSRIRPSNCLVDKPFSVTSLASCTCNCESSTVRSNRA